MHSLFFTGHICQVMENRVLDRWFFLIHFLIQPASFVTFLNDLKGVPHHKVYQKIFWGCFKTELNQVASHFASFCRGPLGKPHFVEILYVSSNFSPKLPFRPILDANATCLRAPFGCFLHFGWHVEPNGFWMALVTWYYKMQQPMKKKQILLWNGLLPFHQPY